MNTNDKAKKNNKGFLYPNSYKKKPTHPDYQGKIICEDQEILINAWENKEENSNKKYLSLRIFKKSEEPNNENKNESKDKPCYLNPNTYKNKATHPDYIGKMFLIDKDYKISAWENKDSHGKQYYSLSVQIFEEKPKTAQVQNTDDTLNQLEEDFLNKFDGPNYNLSDDVDLKTILNNDFDDDPFK